MSAMKPKREHLLKIGVSGVRGVVGEFLTPGLACGFAQAFGTSVGGGSVVLGRDTRSSGAMLEHAVTAGLLSAGCEVVKVGILPTPTIQMYVAATGAAGGIALTASHNPPEYNALKLFNGEGLFFNNYERGELIDLYHQAEFREAGNKAMRGWRSELEAPAQLHIERIVKHIDVDRIRRRRFRVALDGVNGAGSLLSVRFLREVLGCDLHAIWVDPTAVFPREAEPSPASLGALAELTRREGCEIGFGQDPDGDRLAVCDETGVVMDNDEVLALVVDAALPRVEGGVVVNLTTSAVIEEVAKRHGRRVTRTPVGEANVVEGMLAGQTAIGGEGSNGGVIFPHVHYCRDSYTGMAFLLDRLAAGSQTVSELAAGLPKFHRRSGKAAFEHGRLGPLMQALETAHPGARVNRADGLKLELDGGWIHVRASNTEPLLRIAVESRDAERAEELYRGVTELLGG
jgi:phosphomannomutase